MSHTGDRGRGDPEREIQEGDNQAPFPSQFLTRIFQPRNPPSGLLFSHLIYSSVETESLQRGSFPRGLSEGLSSRHGPVVCGVFFFQGVACEPHRDRERLPIEESWGSRHVQGTPPTHTHILEDTRSPGPRPWGDLLPTTPIPQGLSVVMLGTGGSWKHEQL